LDGHQVGGILNASIHRTLLPAEAVYLG
jgi:hypothetical protein